MSPFIYQQSALRSMKLRRGVPRELSPTKISADAVLHARNEARLRLGWRHRRSRNQIRRKRHFPYASPAIMKSVPARESRELQSFHDQFLAQAQRGLRVILSDEPRSLGDRSPPGRKLRL